MLLNGGLFHLALEDPSVGIKPLATRSNMIETQFSEDLISLRMSGSVTDEDWDQVVLAFQNSLGAQFGVRLRDQSGGKFSVLMDWTALEEWKSGARTACTVFCMGYQDMVQRIAVVGTDRWKDERERLRDVYKNAQVRFFQAPKQDAARAWLRGH